VGREVPRPERYCGRVLKTIYHSFNTTSKEESTQLCVVFHFLHHFLVLLVRPQWLVNAAPTRVLLLQ
jgi:hypothetical protein